MDKAYPGNNAVSSISGTSVQAKEKYPARTVIDMLSEETINCDAKSHGGITGFSTKQTLVYKWCMKCMSSIQYVYSKFQIRQIPGHDH